MEEPLLRISQSPHFKLVYDSSVEDLDEMVLTDEEIDEGINQWKDTSVASVVGTEVLKDAM